MPNSRPPTHFHVRDRAKTREAIEVAIKMAKEYQPRYLSERAEQGDSERTGEPSSGTSDSTMQETG